MEGKKEFYKKAKEALESEGYRYYGEDDIKGIGSSHMSKPDYIAVKGNIVVIGEIKSPKEGPTSAIWRQIQNGDGQAFKKVRLDVARKEKEGQISKEAGGHEIIIRGQIPDYVEKMGKTYESPVEIENRKIICGYSFPFEESSNVDHAVKECGTTVHKKINTRNGIVTYFFL